MSKAAREAEIDASLAQPLTARWSTNWPARSWSENCSERDVLRAITLAWTPVSQAVTGKFGDSITK
jgi:hypothetical protein